MKNLNDDEICDFVHLTKNMVNFENFFFLFHKLTNIMNYSKCHLELS